MKPILITSSIDRDLDLNQNLNINDNSYLNRLTANQRQLINKVPSNDSFLYELTEYITDKNRPYSETLMERDGTGQLSTLYTYGNQRINSESYNNLTGLYAYDGRGSVSAVIGTWGDFRASYWYDGLGNVKSQIHGYGAFGSGKKYYGYNAEQYNPVTGNQNLRNRQLNIRRQRFLTEDTFIGIFTETLSINRYIYGNDNPLKFNDPSGFISNVIMSSASKVGPGISCGGSNGNYDTGLVSTGIIYSSSTMLYGPGVDTQQVFRDAIIHGFTGTEEADNLNNLLETFRTINNRIDVMINWAIAQANFPAGFWERNYDNSNRVDNDVIYNDWYYGNTTSHFAWCSVFVIYNGVAAQLSDVDIMGNSIVVMPSHEIAINNNLKGVANLQSWYTNQGRYFSTENVNSGTYVPHKGDVFFVKNGSHTGLVVSYDANTQIVTTVEGNTDPDDGYNGYAVMSKQRKLSKIKGFGYNMYTGDIIQ